jgi:hypothetical protein
MAEVVVSTVETQLTANSTDEQAAVSTTEVTVVATTTEEQVVVTTVETNPVVNTTDEQVVAEVSGDNQVVVAQVVDTGPPGLNAYQVAVAGGFVGTQEEWLASLEGNVGPPGPQGIQGPPGDAKDIAFFALPDVDPTVKEDQWVPAYKEAQQLIQLSDPNVLVTLTDGGNF